MTDPIIYYDIDILNNDIAGVNPEQNVNFTETRNSPFIMNPEDYYMSIIRFQISDTSTLPVFIPEIEQGQNQPWRTIYKVNFVFNSTGNTHSSGNVHVSYTPNNEIPISKVPTFENTAKDPYYYVYNYEDFISDINFAFIEAFNVLFAASPAGSIPSTATPPFLTFDNKTKKISIYALRSIYDFYSGLNIKIFINEPLKRLLNSFQYNDYGHSRDLDIAPLRYLLMFNPEGNRDNIVALSNVSRPKVVTAADYFELESQDLDIVLWNPISSVVFSSSSMPVVPTNTSTPASLVANTGNNKNILTVLTDFQVNITADNSYRQSLGYSPQGEYRLFAMNSSQPLNTIDINVWWKTKYGVLIPFKLPGGGAANMKLLFRHKSFNHNSM
jgi:hypothetical protein